jgi:chromate transporter
MTIAAGSSVARFHTNPVVQSFLKGVTPAVVGLLIAAGISLGRAGIHTWIGLSIAIVAGFVLIRFRPNPFWVIMGAGLIWFLIGFVVH